MLAPVSSYLYLLMYKLFSISRIHANHCESSWWQEADKIIFAHLSLRNHQVKTNKKQLRIYKKSLICVISLKICPVII